MTIIFDIPTIGKMVSASHHKTFEENIKRLELTADICELASQLTDIVNNCENSIAVEELDGYDLENDVDFS